MKKNLVLPSSLLALLGPTVAVTAYAEVYLTDAQAVAVIFPETKMDRSEVTLSNEEAKAIHEISHEDVQNKKLILWKGKDKNFVYIDQVLGKHEFITYAVGLNKDGKIKGVEVLEYRESYGQQIRGASWRKQFVDKDKSAPLELERDIKNISGATLSSAHLTAGVRRLLATHAQIAHRL